MTCIYTQFVCDLARSLQPIANKRPVAVLDDVATVLLEFSQSPVVHNPDNIQRKQKKYPSNAISVFEKRDRNGFTIMHCLAAIGPSASRAVACLASHRLCPLTVRSNSGQTPLDVALEKENRVCAAILDRAIEIRNLNPTDRKRYIQEMAERVAASKRDTCERASRRSADDCCSQELIGAIGHLRGALDQSV